MIFPLLVGYSTCQPTETESSMKNPYLLMVQKSGDHQLRLVVYGLFTIIYRVSGHPNGGFYPDFWTTNTSGSQVPPHPTSSLGQRTPPWVQHKLVVSTPLKKISQNGKLPQIGVNIKNHIWNHQTENNSVRLIRLVVSILLNSFFLCRISYNLPSFPIPLSVLRFWNPKMKLKHFIEFIFCSHTHGMDMFKCWM